MLVNQNNIIGETELAIILSRFNKDFILNVVRDNLINRLNVYQLGLPNLVSSLETDFKYLEGIYPNTEEVKAKRTEVYKDIINILCTHHQLQLNPTIIDDDFDYYSMATILYELLVSQFKFSMVTFFTTYINKEKNTIYNSSNLADLKKSKDVSTAYAKMSINNQKLAIIIANLESVLDSMCGYDISFDDILNNIYPDKNISKCFLNNILPVQDFFKTNYVGYIQHPQTRPTIISEIRLSLYTNAIAE